jgi:hypothetical protein
MMRLAHLLLALQLHNPGLESLVARWDSETRSRGGLGTWIELAANGTCAQTTGAMIDGTWTLEGDRLTLDMKETDGRRHSQSVTVKMTGEHQTQVVSGQSRQLVRVGVAESGATPLIGIWSYPHYAGGQAYEEYRNDGRYLFRLPIRTTPCRWTVNGNQLLIVEGSRKRELRWSLEGDRLVLESGVERNSFRRERIKVIPAASTR